MIHAYIKVFIRSVLFGPHGPVEEWNLTIRISHSARFTSGIPWYTRGSWHCSFHLAVRIIPSRLWVVSWWWLASISGHVTAVAERTAIWPSAPTAFSAVNTQSISSIYLRNKCSICSSLAPVNLLQIFRHSQFPRRTTVNGDAMESFSGQSVVKNELVLFYERGR